jgi:hypothetical protein
VDFAGDVLQASWRLADASRLYILANLGERERARTANLVNTRPIWGGTSPERLPAWSVYCGIGGA